MIKKFLFCLPILLLSINSVENFENGFIAKTVMHSIIKDKEKNLDYVKDKATIKNFEEKFDFYSDISYGSNIVLANTIQDVTDNSVNSIKIILNPKQYYIDNKTLSLYDNIVEFVYLTSDRSILFFKNK